MIHSHLCKLELLSKYVVQKIFDFWLNFIRDFPININTGTAQWDLIRERQEQKLRQAREKEILLSKDVSEIVLTEVKGIYKKENKNK